MRTDDLNATWAGIILDRLRAHGVTDLCIAPGSRSAPLALAAARRSDGKYPCVIHTHFDERGLAFYALGLIRAIRRPVAVITTSGTAVSNLHPAVAEASQSHLPLVLITADRPPELHHCGANQTMPQQHLFDSLLRAGLALPPPEPKLCGDWLHRHLDTTLAKILSPGRTAGPVHFNVPLREPLYGGREQARKALPLPDVRAQRPAAALPGPIATPLLFVAGQLSTEEAASVLITAEAGNIPILADIGSQLRLRTHPCILGAAELLLASPSARQALEQARQVIQFGGQLTGRRLPAWLNDHAPERYIISPFDQDLDPYRQATTLQADVATTCRALQTGRPQECLPGLAKARDQVAAVCRSLLTDSPFAEPAAAERISRILPPEMALFVGNSLPIRVFDSFALPGHGNPCLTQRGVSGIDGLIATAAGFNSHHRDGLTLVIGDLSALHDLNSLALLSQARHCCIVVVFNNDGGGIFDTVASRGVCAETHRDLFQMPHGYDFRATARQFRLPYWLCNDGDSLEAAHRAARCHSGGSLIEVTCPAGTASALIKTLGSRLEVL